jgi:hypothetical protein
MRGESDEMRTERTLLAHDINLQHMINRLKEEALEEQSHQRKIILPKEHTQKKIGVCHSSCTSVTN